MPRSSTRGPVRTAPRPSSEQSMRSKGHLCIRNLTCSFAPLSCHPLLTESLGYKLEDRPPVLRNQLHPFPFAHLRKIDSSKAQSRDEHIYSITNGVLIDRIDCSLDGLGAVRTGPRVLDLGMGL